MKSVIRARRIMMGGNEGGLYIADANMTIAVDDKGLHLGTIRTLNGDWRPAAAMQITLSDSLFASKLSIVVSTILPFPGCKACHECHAT